MSRLPSVMKRKFSEVPSAQIPRSTFDRSFGYKTTFDAGYLIPVYVDEALPGDTFTLRMNAFARLATPLKPLMDNMFMETFFFAVPYRLVWDNWQKFNGEQVDPGDSTDFVIPHITVPVGGYATGSLEDYLGLPVPGLDGMQHSALWHRAYNLIFNEWFRDQNLQNSLPVPRDDGPDSVASYKLMRRNKRHDYFTSCLPWPQKGPSVQIPADSPVVSNQTTVQLGTFSVGQASMQALASGALQMSTAPPGTESVEFSSVNQTGLAIDINQLRQAFQIQKLLERDARGGTRYTEVIWSQFRVKSPDSRLQRPEYLGGGSAPVIVSPIAQTSATDAAVSPQGNLAAIGTTSFSGHGFFKSFTEHCLLLGLVNVRADLTYQEGLDRMWSRQTRYDFYWPALAHIGEQAVLTKEIFANTLFPDSAFGYQERYAEYRYKPSKITGLFRSTVAGSLDIWHLSQDFGAAPVLDEAFIQEDPPVDRVIAVQSEPHFLFDSYFTLRCARPMPVYGVPGLADHF